MSWYDAKARDLFRSLVMDEARSVPRIAALLESVYAEGWNAAVAEFEVDAASPAAAPEPLPAKVCGYAAYGFGPCVLPVGHDGTHTGASEWAKQQGYAAAPAAEPCCAGAASGGLGHSLDCPRFPLTAPNKHEDWCALFGNPEAGKSCDCRPVAPSLLPRVLAALEDHRGCVACPVLAAELRRYIAEMEGKT